MGEVWLGIHPRTDAQVAIKTLPDFFVRKDETFVARFRKEGRTAARIDHPNVVKVFDLGQDDDVHYLVMQYIDGGTLKDLLKKQGAFPAGEALRIVIGVADGLRAAAALDIIHRDIKPDNIMLDSHGIPKITDLGLAKQMGESTAGVSLTGTGTAIGTPAYMSPEQAEDAKSADCRSDIYSLGATFYHLLAGVPPFEGPTAMSVILKHLRDPLPPVQERAPHVSDELSAILEKMLAKDRDERYQSYDELLADLRAAAGRAIGGLPQSGDIPRLSQGAGTVREESGGRRSRQWLLWAVVGSGLALAALAVLLNRGGRVAGNGVPMTAAVAVVDTVPPAAVIAPPAATAELPTAGDWIDLLPLIDLQRDGLIPSQWRTGPDGVVCDSQGEETPAGMLVLPYSGTGNYEFEIRFTRQAGTNSIGQYFTLGTGRAVFEMDCWGLASGGIQMIDDHSNYDNVTSRQGIDLPIGELYTMSLKVVGNRFDGRLAGGSYNESWAYTSPRDGAELQTPKAWAFPPRARVGLAVYGSRVIFHQIRVRRLP